MGVSGSRLARPLTVQAQVGVPIAAGIALLAARASGMIPADVSLCLFRNITGIPCPMCGGLSAAGDLLRGNVLTAWSTNPFAVMFIVAASTIGLLNRVRPTASRHFERWARSKVGILMLATYVGMWLTWWAVKVPLISA